MKIIKSELNVAFDVDGTLLIKAPTAQKDTNTVTILDPYFKKHLYFYPHWQHIHYLKQLHIRGHIITVWSHGGWKWAKAAVEALNLTKHVDYVQSKPILIVDDLPTEKGIGVSIFLPFDKNNTE